MPWKKWSCLKPVSCVKIVTCNNISDESDHWPLIGQERSRDLDTGLWLADRVITYRMRSGSRQRNFRSMLCEWGRIWSEPFHSTASPRTADTAWCLVSCPRITPQSHGHIQGVGWLILDQYGSVLALEPQVVYGDIVLCVALPCAPCATNMS